MKLTIEQIKGIAAALAHLDGGTVLQSVEGKAVPVFRSYRLAGSARWLGSLWSRALKTAEADFENAKAAIIARHTEGATEIKTGHKNYAACLKECQELHAAHTAIEINHPPIPLEHLKLDENEAAGNGIPIAVLNALAPIIAG